MDFSKMKLPGKRRIQYGQRSNTFLRRAHNTRTAYHNMCLFDFQALDDSRNNFPKLFQPPFNLPYVR